MARHFVTPFRWRGLCPSAQLEARLMSCGPFFLISLVALLNPPFLVFVAD